MKRILITLLIVIVLGAIWYGYRLYHEKNADLTSSKPSITTTAISLIQEFEKDSAASGKKYTDQVIAVSGQVKSISAEDNPVIISMGDAGEMSSVQCSMDSSHSVDYASVKEGSRITIKGKCTGYEAQDLLGTDIKMNRCVLINDPK
jgi:hypothetical protein